MLLYYGFKSEQKNEIPVCIFKSVMFLISSNLLSLNDINMDLEMQLELLYFVWRGF